MTMEPPPLLLPGLTPLRAVRTPRHLRTLGRVAAALLLALPIVLVATPWQQTAPGTGRVIAFDPQDRQQVVDAPVEGRVARWHVSEGDTVAAGDVIAEISDLDAGLVGRLGEERDATLSKIESAAAQVAINQERISRLEEARQLANEAADQRIQMAEERVEIAIQREVAAAAAVETARLNAERQRKLQAEGLASARAVELADLEVQRTTTDREQAASNVTSARAEVLSLRAERLRVDADAGANLDAARANVQAASEKEATALGELARLEVRVARQGAQIVRAPRDGRILRIATAEGGDVVKAGDPLAILVPEHAEPAVEIQVDGNDLPLVQEGQPVRLQFEGWPALQLAGWPGVAVGTFGGRVAVVDATDGGAGRFRVVITPDPGEPAWPDARWLRQGVRSNAWVMLGQVSLGWEIWRRFNGFPPAVPSKDGAKDAGPKGIAPGGKK